MMWGIYWHPAALHGFNALHMDDAERLDAAVIGFARRGRGPVAQIAPPDPRRLWLLVRGAGAVLYLDPDARMISVVAVFRRR